MVFSITCCTVFCRSTNSTRLFTVFTCSNTFFYLFKCSSRASTLLITLHSSFMLEFSFSTISTRISSRVPYLLWISFLWSWTTSFGTCFFFSTGTLKAVLLTTPLTKNLFSITPKTGFTLSYTCIIFPKLIILTKFAG